MDLERLGPYQIVGKLGRGGMGTVYEGVHRETGETAAIKLLSAALAQEEDFRGRFEAEIETLRKLNHPNIVRLFGFGEQEELLFYAMELVDGSSLEEELRQGRRFDWREVARIGIETCRALRHAHDRGVIHRDIKPGNILLTADGRVKLSDFGIARLFGYSRLTNVGNVLGTAEYMAPEQAEGRAVEPRSDLYSLGALMYALLARRPVFRGKSLPEVLHKQRFEQPEPVRKYAADVPEELERILAQLLEKNPDRRISNADILGRRLEAMLHALSVSSETVEADADWFQADEPPAQSDDVPTTEILARPEKRCQEPFRPVHTASGEESAEMVPDTFIPVGEEDLDRVEEERPRPAMISWQTWALAAALLFVGLSAWWFLQSPTADALYDKITARTADQTTASVLQAEKEIEEFLRRFSNDFRAARLREYQKEIELYHLERKFDLRIKGLASTKGLLPIEQAYLEAANSARLNPDRGEAKLRALLDLYDRPGDDTGPTGQCLALAKRRLAQLRKEIAERAAEEMALLRGRLDTADSLRQSDPERAKTLYRAVVELYGDKPWAADAVGRARKSLENRPAR